MRTRATIGWISLAGGALSACLAAAAFPADQPPSVGSYGHPARLIVRGATSIPAEAVKQALLNDAEVLLAGHPRAPLDDYPHTLRRRTTDGYHREGFPDARVHVEIDKESQQVVVTVDEGPRFVCGNVRIEGARRLDEATLTEQLTQPRPPSGAAPLSFNEDGSVKRWTKLPGEQNQHAAPSEPVWKRGDPAPFGFPHRFTLSRLVGEMLADLGFAAAAYDVSVVPDRDTKTADLLITIADEGLPSRVAAIDITGCERNSREAVLRYLDLTAGQLYAPSLRARAAHKLWRSGRFRKSEVLVERHDDGAVDLKIALVESPHAPPLESELSEHEQILLRCREWLVKLEDSGYDLVIDEQFDHQAAGRTTRLHFGFVIAGRSGAIISAGATGDGDAAGRASELPPYGLVLSDELVALYATRRGVKLAGQPLDGYFNVEFAFGLTDAPDGDKPVNLGFNFNFGNKRTDPDMPPFDFSVRYDPVAFVELAHIWQPGFDIRDGVMTLRTREGAARIEVESGRLIDYRRINPEFNSQTTLSTEKGAFARRLRELEQATSRLKNEFDSQRPATSLASFILNDDALLEVLKQVDPGEAQQNVQRAIESWRRFHGLARKLVKGDALAPLDRLLAAPSATPAGEFRIPTYGTQGGGAPRGLDVADDLFQRDSWAWTIWRETALSISGHGKYTEHELKRMYEAPETGPLCHLAIAALLDWRAIPLARQFASRGLERLTVVDFQNDYRALLDKESVAGACLLKAAEVARDLNDDEAEAVGRALFGDDARYFIDFARTLRRRRGESIEAVLPEALDVLWESGLSHFVGTALRGIQAR